MITYYNSNVVEYDYYFRISISLNEYHAQACLSCNFYSSRLRDGRLLVRPTLN